MIQIIFKESPEQFNSEYVLQLNWFWILKLLTVKKCSKQYCH
jgi:hypothetical protein